MISPEQISEVVRILVARCDPEEIILFGSYAHGTAHEESDLDLAVIQKTDLPFRDRIIECRLAIRAGGRRWLFPMDILVFTPEEMEADRDNQYSIIHEIHKTGKMLYERQKSVRLAA